MCYGIISDRKCFGTRGYGKILEYLMSNMLLRYEISEFYVQISLISDQISFIFVKIALEIVL